MGQSEVMIELLERGHGMLQKTLADFTDADLLVRPCEGANYAEWLLGHLCKSETGMLGAAGGDTSGLLPDGFGERYPQVKDRANEVTNPLGKAKLVATLDAIRQRTIAYVKSLDDAGLARQIPSPFNKGSMTTVAFLLNMPALHMSMHVGQLQVIRRKLGKPILF